MKIILIILLIISLLIIYFFGKVIIRQAMVVQEIQKYVNELEFYNGGEIDHDLVLNEYKNALLITSYVEGSEEVISIWDVSQYEKNKVIGLTTCGPSKLIDEALRRAMLDFPEKFMGMDEDMLRELRKEIGKEIGEEWSIYGMVDVYQMKDGTWLWR